MTIFNIKLNQQLRGDKIKLPPSQLEQLLQVFGVDAGGLLPHPLTFKRGSSPSKNHHSFQTFGTVLEFTANEEMVEIGGFLAKSFTCKRSC